MKRTRITAIAVLTSLLFVAGCKACIDSGAASAYLDSVGLSYETYVLNDTSLTQEQKDRRLQAQESFRRLVEEAENE